jgi:gamma-glutamyl hydrolase
MFNFYCIISIFFLYFNLLNSTNPLPNNVRPVIGILTQPPIASSDGINLSLIDSSYVKWLESGGAMVVPILFNETSDNIELQFHKLNGVLFTGGPSKPTDFNRYFQTENLLYNLCLKYNQPLWGTCLGFQSISDIIAGKRYFI